MSNRIYVQHYGAEPDVEIDAAESIAFEREGVRIRVFFDAEGEIRVNADERVTITPEASNVFVIRPRDPRTVLAARRVRKALGASERMDLADVRALIEAGLR